MAQTTNLSVSDSKSDGPAQKPRSVRKLIVLLLIVLIVLLAIGALFYFLTQGQKEELEKNQELTTESGEINLPQLNRPFVSKDDFFEEQPFFSERLDFTINLLDGRRFLKVGMKLGLTDERAMEYLSTRMPLVKDIIITTTQLLNSGDFRSGTGVEQYKRNLLVKINSMVYTQEFKTDISDLNPVKKILFEEFILQ